MSWVERARPFLISAVVGTAVGVAGTLAWKLTASPPGVTPENFGLLCEGMTEREVVSILGKPANRIAGGPELQLFWADDGWFVALAFRRHQDADGAWVNGILYSGWMSPSGGIVPNDAIVRIREHEGVLDRLRRWLGL